MDWECVRIALRLHNFSNLAAILLEGSGQPALNVINAAAVSSTCIRMISQRYESGTISTPEGGAVVNGAFLGSGKAFDHENGNDEQII